MDRKSFFKRALLAIGAAVVPEAILKAAPKEDNTKHLLHEFEGPPMSPYQDGVMPLYQQMQRAFGDDTRVVKADKFYWMEWTKNDFRLVEGFTVPEEGLPYTTNKDGSVSVYGYVGVQSKK
jgi:hypothetical protein